MRFASILSGLSILACKTLAAVATPSVVTEVTGAATCPTSMPVIIASKTFDGDTEINSWTDTPIADHMLIGGTTYSRDITETNDECVAGCALVAVWRKDNNSWFSRYVYTNMRGVLSVKTNFVTKKSVILFSRSLNSGIKAFAFGFLDWTPNDDGATPTNMEPIQVGWQAKFPYDERNWNNFSNYFLLQDDRMHLIANHPNENEVVDLWFILSDDRKSIEYAYKEDFTLKRNGRSTKFVAPTYKYNLVEGYDAENTISLAQITLPKGANQLGKSLTLNEETTYTCIISRTWQPIDRAKQAQEQYLFKSRDRIYSWKQDSSSEYYTYPAMSTYVDPNGGHYIFTAGSNSQRAYEILVSGFSYQSTHTVTHSQTKRYQVNESNAVQVISVNQNTMSTDPFQLYVIYLIPAEGFRGKILSMKLDTVLSTTELEDIAKPLTYYFMRPVDLVKGEIWNQYPLFFHYDRLEDSFYYAGRTNYIEGPSNKLYEKVNIDWTQDRLNFGFINQYTNNLACKSAVELDQEENIYRFGVTHYEQQEFGNSITWLTAQDNVWNYTEVGMEDGSPVAGWWREPNLLEIVNMNSTNWEELEAENEGEEFDVQYNDWISPRFGAEQYIKRLIGLNWLDKFQLNRDTYRTSETSKGEKASIWMFAIGCVNLVLSLLVAILEIPAPEFQFYQIVMLLGTLFHMFAALPTIVIWIIVQVTAGSVGDDYESSIGWMTWVVRFVDATDIIYLVCAPWGYVVTGLLVFLSAYLLPVLSIGTGYRGNFAAGLGFFLIYCLYAGANWWAQGFFAPQLQIWSVYFKKVVEESDALGENGEAIEGEDAEKEKDGEDKIEEGENWNEGDQFDLTFNNWSMKENIEGIGSSLNKLSSHAVDLYKEHEF